METIITLLSDYVTGLLKAQEDFIEHLDAFPELEQTVVELSNRMAAGFLGACLTTADALICKSGRSRKALTVQRHRTRTLVSSVGDITFTHTLYKDSDGHIRCLLDEAIKLPDRERFTTVAEAKILSEAEVHSYQHAAESIHSGSQTITKVTVMNKIHAIEKELHEPDPIPEVKKQVRYLYVEADEDHIHRQKDGENNGCFIGKLVYLFEGKEEVCKGRRKLVSPHFFGGIYNGTDSNTELWKSVEDYIESHYDTDYLTRVYISGDGGSWIKAATDHIIKSKAVIDRFHLMKYIYRVSGYTKDDRDETVGRFYKYIYKDNLLAAKKLLTRIQSHCDGSDNAVEECRSFLMNNWAEIQTAFHDKHVIGCSAEGHVSSLYSERMSSRPMGWSETGTDRMCRLRCYVGNYGRGKIMDLVRYRRERELNALEATGTDGMIDENAKPHLTPQQRSSKAYIERLQATIDQNTTVYKILAIREQISLL